MDEKMPKREAGSEKEEDRFHRFLLRIDKDLWESFLNTLPLSVSANEKVVQLIYEYVVLYERVVNEAREVAGFEDK